MAKINGAYLFYENKRLKLKIIVITLLVLCQSIQAFDYRYDFTRYTGSNLRNQNAGNGSPQFSKGFSSNGNNPLLVPQGTMVSANLFRKCLFDNNLCSSHFF
jgi:hypothetical protein